jgi:hypothetical protein
VRSKRTRIAVCSVLVGLVLLATALVRYVTARDVQRQDPTASLQDLPTVVGLVAGRAALVGGEAAALARWSRPALMTVAGAVLLGASGVQCLFACDARRPFNTRAAAANASRRGGVRSIRFHAPICSSVRGA